MQTTIKLSTLTLLVYLPLGVFGQSTPKLFALTVGIEKYSDPGVPPLRFCVEDASDIAAALEEQSDLYEIAEIKVLTDKDATKTNIKNEMKRIGLQVGPRDLFVLFFSGHGIPDSIVPYDFKSSDRQNTLLSKNELAMVLGPLPCKNYLIMIDACHSGSFINPNRRKSKQLDNVQSLVPLSREDTILVVDNDPTPVSPPDSEPSPLTDPFIRAFANQDGNYIVFTSSASEEVSWECASCGHGYFAQAFLDCLDGKSYRDTYQNKTITPLTDAKNRIDVSDLAKYLDQVVSARTSTQGKNPQRVQMVNKSSPSFPIFKLARPDQEIVKTVVNKEEKLIKGDSFEMGDVFGEGKEHERPVHSVLVADFYMSLKEVTFEEFDAFCRATNRPLPDDEGWGRGQLPVINVSWYDAIAYCNWRSVKNGRTPVYSINGEYVNPDWNADGYRLPTEAEWEFAARAGGKRLKWSGSNDERLIYRYANYKDAGKDSRRTNIVGSYDQNELGLSDMSGNVAEWCWDRYNETFYEKPEAKHNPRGPNTGKLRVLRGGSWESKAKFIRTTDRWFETPDYKASNIGFRLVRSKK